MDNSNNIYWADTNCALVWMINYSTGIASVVAGSPGSGSSIVYGTCTATGCIDGAMGTGKMNSQVWDVAYNSLTNMVYIVDGTPNNAIRKYDPTTVRYVPYHIAISFTLPIIPSSSILPTFTCNLLSLILRHPLSSMPPVPSPFRDL